MNTSKDKTASTAKPQQALFLLRILAGGYLFWQGFQKFEDPLFQQQFPGLIEAWSYHHPIVIYQQFLAGWVLPNASWIAKIIPALEMGLGLAVATGFYFSIAIIAAGILVTLYTLSTQHLGYAWQGLNFAYLTILLALYWGEASAVASLDNKLKKQRQNNFSDRASNMQMQIIAALQNQVTASKKEKKKGSKSKLKK